ncbi:MFS transporter [Kibdelosporangium lantanae]
MSLGVTTRYRAMGALFTTVALTNTATTLATTAGTLIAGDVGPAAWSGLPSAANVLGTALGTLLAARLTGLHGRRRALLTGYGLGTLGTATAFLGAAVGSLTFLLLGTVLLGVGNGAAQLSRYLAADLYPPERKGFALSAVVWAGTVGALAGPLLIAPAAAFARSLGLPELSGPVLFAVVAVAGSLVAAVVLPPDEVKDQRRPEGWSVLRRPELRLPLTAMVVAQVVMVAVMTMTPPQLHHLGHSLDTVGWILSAHIFGMFALSPVTGKFADRFGGRVTVGAGVAVLAAATGLAFAFPESHTTGLPIALFLLGYGWNLMFVGGSSLLSRTLPTGSQGAVDAVVWGSSVLGSVGAGQLFGSGGYALVAGIAAVVALLPVVALLGLPRPR